MTTVLHVVLQHYMAVRPDLPAVSPPVVEARYPFLSPSLHDDP